MGTDGSPTQWLSFEDDDEQRTWMLDVTFLTSAWTCIFGAGCQGVLTAPAPELVQGCCSYGAHFSDEADVRRVEKAARKLTAEEWQFKSAAKDGISAKDGEATTTALVDGACIFLNRPGFSGGVGCALHIASMRLGVPHLELKPDVCWQLPLRRQDLVEDDGHVVSTITGWQRRHWGEAGEDFAWWCTEAPEAFVARKPVYVTLADELEALMGRGAFAKARGYLDEAMSEPVRLRPKQAKQKAKR